MATDSESALRIVRDCVATDRYMLLPHLRDQLRARGVLWDEVRVIIDAPVRLRFDGYDALHREKWVLSGYTDLTQKLSLVCMLDSTNEGDDFVVFMTVHSWR